MRALRHWLTAGLSFSFTCCGKTLPMLRRQIARAAITARINPWPVLAPGYLSLPLAHCIAHQAFLSLPEDGLSGIA